MFSVCVCVCVFLCFCTGREALRWADHSSKESYRLSLIKKLRKQPYALKAGASSQVLEQRKRKRTLGIMRSDISYQLTVKRRAVGARYTIYWISSFHETDNDVHAFLRHTFCRRDKTNGHTQRTASYERRKYQCWWDGPSSASSGGKL
jgi:hypothetical protein